ncbi:MGMT family protein [Candidatus Dojkabacteria bacterium]|nr:MGMT family protein [Candidatus Dojkabacteria bacterium]
MATKKSWAQKAEEANSKGCIRKRTPKGMMYISTPKEIEKIIRRIPKGKLMTTKQIADKLSKKYKVDFTCPLTTGIFTSIVANVAEEQMEMGKGKKDVAPYWRVVKPPKGFLYDKYLGNIFPQDKYLKEEGFKIVPSGTKKGPVVKDYEKYLII